jgi:hypothetical protein
MEKYYKYFKNQVKFASEHFEEWLNNKESILFGSHSIYNDLYDTFSSYHKSQKGKENDIAHNCIGCNFDEGARNIQLFFKYNLDVNSERYFLTMYSLLFYLQAERLGVIYKEIGFVKTVRNKEVFDWLAFPELQRIKCWANFFKHPKDFMLLHHPSFFIEGDPNIPNFLVNGVINDSFIQKYYKGDNHNKDLRLILENKENFIVIFPNLLDFTVKLCLEFERIVDKIKNDTATIEKLAPYTTIKSSLSN